MNEAIHSTKHNSLSFTHHHMMGSDSCAHRCMIACVKRDIAALFGSNEIRVTE